MTRPMLVTVQLFAVLRERVGLSELALELGPSPSADDVKRGVAERYPAVRELLAKTAVAVNRQYATPQTPIQPGDEVALIPPVSGG